MALDLSLIEYGKVTKYKNELKSLAEKYKPSIEIQKSQLFHAYRCKNIDYPPIKNHKKQDWKKRLNKEIMIGSPSGAALMFC